MDQAVRRCAVFDMDGTLADTRAISVPALVAVARAHGIEPPSPERVAAAIGIGGIEFYHLVYPDAPHGMLERLARETFEREAAIARSLGPKLLFDGVYDLLSALAERGVALAIASTGETEHVDSVLGCTGIRGFFAIVRCNSNDKAAMIGEIAALLPRHAMVMVGDKPKDSDAARANGIPSVGAGYGFSTPEELRGFDAVVGHPMEVLAFLR